MDDPLPEPQNLRFLRLLVTVLTATMILGIGTIVVLLFIRFSAETPAQSAPLLPDTITLPDGVTARALTVGGDWYAVVTEGDEILIFDRADGRMRQRILIASE